ncbi:unnamed protein product [Rotaria sp. Silwood2]|nr:unnamed protein product [Rotaria sp. Silwood2]CAF4804755.1 unnamed protein product [Rotaria sp. Silwood2]
MLEKFKNYIISESDLKDGLESEVAEHVPEQHIEYQKYLALVAKAFSQNRPEYLLRLYTLETPLYRALHAPKLSTSIMVLLSKLKPHYFQGLLYRGLKMTTVDLSAYRWSLKNK